MNNGAFSIDFEDVFTVIENITHLKNLNDFVSSVCISIMKKPLFRGGSYMKRFTLYMNYKNALISSAGE